MLETIEQINEANKIINGVDSPNLLSVDSTNPIPFVVDKVEDSGSSAELKNPTAEETKAAAEKKEELTKTEDKTNLAKPAEPHGAVKTEVKVEAKKEDEKPSTDDAVQKRINKAVKAQRIAERERDFERQAKLKAEEELAKLRSKLPVEGEPNKEDFDDVEDYNKALTAWTVKETLRTEQEKVAKTAEEEHVKQVELEKNEALDEALDAGRAKYADFDAVALAKEVMITEDLVVTILDSEIAEEIMYYLGKNPDEAADLSKLNPRRAAREVTKIEAKLLAVATTKKDELTKPEEIKTPVPKPNEASLGGVENQAAPTPKKITEAPEPITPVSTTGATEKDPNSMTPKEYRAWREKNK